MDIHSNLEYLCRVCAANTKGKNSVAECVYILKTAGLKDKLEKFLYLKIADNDPLPKVLCKTCFRQVEATASLSKIARDTQQVFRDFLLSNLPKGPSQSTITAEFTSSDFSTKKDSNKKSKNDAIMMVAPPAPANSVNQMPQPQTTTTATILVAPAQPLLQPPTSSARKDEVVVNVSVSDPLTRDNQQKMISNSQRRQSLLLDSRFTPKSIAQKPSSGNQKASVTPVPIAAKPNPPMEITNNNSKTSTPTLNFYPINKTPNKQQQQQANQQQQIVLNTPQITTYPTYVIGRFDNGPDSKPESKKVNQPLASTPDNVLQQKRKNLVKALNNIKANNSGQVSLLKSSQQKQTGSGQNNAKLPLAEVVNQSVEDELPERIIIAAPKNKATTEKTKKEPLNLSSKIPASIVAQPQVPKSTTSITAMPQQPMQQQQQSESANSMANPLPKPGFPEDILLGRVIRDMDLLKLILKALKWPVNKQNMELQIQRLKNSKFIDVMSDQNLLQDTDLTQLLGPYLAPVLMAAQALQQQQQEIMRNAAALNQSMANNYIAPPQPPPTVPSPKITALEAAQAEINKSIPYKLPPETSVQLVPATPEEMEPTPSPPLNNINTSNTSAMFVPAKTKKEKQKESSQPLTEPPKRQRRAAAQRARDSIVISDEEDEAPPKKSRQRKSNSKVKMNDFLPQFTDAGAALMALLQQQNAAILKDKKVQRRRRNSVSNLIALQSNEFDALIDLDDDIVLMEPVSTTSGPSETPAAPSTSSGLSLENLQQKMDLSNSFVIPSVPLITRPIIKRRKTVIHSSRGGLGVTADMKSKDQSSITSSTISPSKAASLLLDETINQVATGQLISDTPIEANLVKTITTEDPTNLLNSPDLSPSKAAVAASNPPKKAQTKSSLGQQLLEAIGLQKISNKQVTEAATSSTTSTILPIMPNSKQSIQQIRSALKKSLKQAQEQQQQKKKELSSSSNNTIIQDADSTTKTAIKEILVVEDKGNKSDVNSSNLLDVEDQIDKVTLMVRQNDNEVKGQSKVTTMAGGKDEKKEMKKSASKIQDRKRTLLNLATKGARLNVEAEIKEKSQKDEEGEAQGAKDNEEANMENEKSEKDDSENANISSSSNVVSVTSNETNTSLNEEVATPKRRGRKRLIDKQNENEASESNEKEKDNKTSPSTTEKSKSKEEDNETESNIKTEEDSAGNNNSSPSGRPTRQSKTQSKYYKGPDKLVQKRRSLPSRKNRNRKYS